MAERESRTLGSKANKALINELALGSTSNKMQFTGVQMANGIAEGIKTQYSVVRDALQETVSGAVNSIRSLKPDEIFSFQGDDPLTKYFNAIFVDGDWQNDWITHLPESMRDMVRRLVVKWKDLKDFLFMMLGTFLDGEKYYRIILMLFNIDLTMIIQTSNHIQNQNLFTLRFQLYWKDGR